MTQKAPKMRIVDKNFCMSSYLAFRYIINENYDFYDHTRHRVYSMIPENQRIGVVDENDIDNELKKQFDCIKEKRLGILLSGGMDSACLASYMIGCDAYTFRFLGGSFQKNELQRAEYYANKYRLNIHYVDISWNTVKDNLEVLMKSKGAPIHSIEPQILAAAKQAKKDGIERMIIGDAADYVFAGMDGLYAKDWTFGDFVKRYTYIEPKTVLNNPIDMTSAYEEFRQGRKIDFIGFMHKYADEESYASYENAFMVANMPFLDPYEILKMSEPLDLYKIRNGNSKYLIRALFKKKYSELPVPEKIPMPRPVDEYFRKWKGPKRPEFCKRIDMSQFTGNQKWQLFCLERFLDMNE